MGGISNGGTAIYLKTRTCFFLHPEHTPFFENLWGRWIDTNLHGTVLTYWYLFHLFSQGAPPKDNIALQKWLENWAAFLLERSLRVSGDRFIFRGCKFLLGFLWFRLSGGVFEEMQRSSKSHDFGVPLKSHQHKTKKTVKRTICTQNKDILPHVTEKRKKKIDPKWVPKSEMQRGSNTWHEMKGPWRLSNWTQPMEFKQTNKQTSKQTKNYQTVFVKGVSYDPRWWRSRWCFPSQILLEMWIYAQEEANTSEELTKSSQMAQVK